MPITLDMTARSNSVFRILAWAFVNVWITDSSTSLGLFILLLSFLYFTLQKLRALNYIYLSILLPLKDQQATKHDI